VGVTVRAPRRSSVVVPNAHLSGGCGRGESGDVGRAHRRPGSDTFDCTGTDEMDRAIARSGTILRRVSQTRHSDESSPSPSELRPPPTGRLRWGTALPDTRRPRRDRSLPENPGGSTVTCCLAVNGFHDNDPLPWRSLRLGSSVLN